MTAPTDRNRKRGPSRHTERSRRTPLSPPCRGNDTLIDKAISHLWPWTVKNYPGLRRATLALLGCKLTWQAVQHWRAGRHPLPARAADTLANAIEARAMAGMQLVSTLRDHAKAMRLAQGCRAAGRLSASATAPDRFRGTGGAGWGKRRSDCWTNDNRHPRPTA